ncbi:hypothetical protein GBAR_LOCUS5809, partial [Geodia barretti]
MWYCELASEGPRRVRDSMVLASNAADTSLEDMAQLADRIIVHSAALSSVSPAQDEVKALRTEIDRQKELVTSLVSRPRSCQPSPS